MVTGSCIGHATDIDIVRRGAGAGDRDRAADMAEVCGVAAAPRGQDHKHGALSIGHGRTLGSAQLIGAVGGWVIVIQFVLFHVSTRAPAVGLVMIDCNMLGSSVVHASGN